MNVSSENTTALATTLYLGLKHMTNSARERTGSNTSVHVVLDTSAVAHGEPGGPSAGGVQHNVPGGGGGLGLSQQQLARAGQLGDGRHGVVVGEDGVQPQQVQPQQQQPHSHLPALSSVEETIALHHHTHTIDAEVAIHNAPADTPEDDDDVEDTVLVVSTSDKVGTRDTVAASTCLICMQHFTKRHPAMKIPCENNCNDTPVHAKCIYEWKVGQKQIIGSCPLCRGSLGQIPYSAPDVIKPALFNQFAPRKNFVVHPIPKSTGIVRCYLLLTHAKTWPYNAQYEMYMQAPTSLRYPMGPLPTETSPAPGDVLLLTARKQFTRYGRPIIDMSVDQKVAGPISRRSPGYMGRVVSSLSGLQHTVTTPYCVTACVGATPTTSGRFKSVELAAVSYSQNRVGVAVGPRKMKVCLPKNVQDSPASMNTHDEDIPEADREVDISLDDGKEWVTAVHIPRKRSQTLGGILGNGKKAVEEHESVTFAANTEPYWLDQIQAYSLDFQGRVTLPSNKNFQLVVDPGASNAVSLQFGKVVEGPKEVYTMDIQWPLSPLQAFGIVLSACNRKLACA